MKMQLYSNSEHTEFATREGYWCHNRPTCLVAARLNGIVLVAESYNCDDWIDRYSKCIGCGKYINKPRKVKA